MRLLDEDQAYLREKGYTYEVLADGEAGCLVIKAFALAPGKYDRDTVDLMVCIPKGYNDAHLDNFYVDPELRLKATGEYPQAASVFENHGGRRWQRFSRHMPKWRPGIDTLKSFLPCAYRELQDTA
jgi:hypothetical protein